MQKRKISRIFQSRLLICILIAFAFTTALLWVIQTKMVKKTAAAMLYLNINDVRNDIQDASDSNLLELAGRIVLRLNQHDKINSAMLKELAKEYEVAEINLVDKNGIITASTYDKFLNYDMRSGRQSSEFMVLIDSKTKEYVQQYQPVSYDSSMSRKYAGIAFYNGGFVQVGYDAENFQRDIEMEIRRAVRNRHIGRTGSLIIADKNWTIVSELHTDIRESHIGRNLVSSGLWLDISKIKENQIFKSNVYGIPSYVLYQVSEGFRIIAVIPKAEVELYRNFSVLTIGAMEFMIFSMLFFLIYMLIKKIVVDNISRINKSLGRISRGNLEEVVNVRDNIEFDELSTDINSTVGTLKKYIADASARIDAELSFARTIQHSAMPSVFPPFPNRRDISIYASMDTAKEVGGDFYDFYFIDINRIVFLIADVSGKGIPAAMFMMRAKTLLKSLAETGLSVAEVLMQANERLCENNDAGMFVTAWMGVLNLSTGELSYANAGHNPPFVIREDGKIEMLKKKPGLVLAGMPAVRYRAYKVQLNPGDVVYLYTDGVTEAVNASSGLFGTERLFEAAEMGIGLSVKQLCINVKKDIDGFAGGAPQADDITMLAFRYCGAEGESPDPDMIEEKKEEVPAENGDDAAGIVKSENNAGTENIAVPVQKPATDTESGTDNSAANPDETAPDSAGKPAE